MLSAVHRLTGAESFRETTRRGQRRGARTIVTHLFVPSSADPGVHSGGPPRVGFVVSKAVGNSVVRNRVQRRLRHLARARVEALPAGSLLVVRALPRSARASYADLDADLTHCLDAGTGTGPGSGTGR